MTLQFASAGTEDELRDESMVILSRAIWDWRISTIVVVDMLARPRQL